MNGQYDVYMCRNPLDKLIGWHKSKINTVEFHSLCDEAQKHNPNGGLLAILVDDSTGLIVKTYFK